jgi:hypothetical protein
MTTQQEKQGQQGNPQGRSDENISHGGTDRLGTPWREITDKMNDPQGARDVLDFCVTQAKRNGMTRETLQTLINEGYSGSLSNR